MDYVPVLTPSDFVAVFNQTIDIAFPAIVLNGEVSNFRISKNKWVYFDLKDEYASLKCFATVYNLKLPIEDGMKVSITAKPQLHPLYNLSLTVIDIKPSGDGSIKKATDILKEKLEKEGLFSDDRKRQLPYPPKKVGLITSSESAAYGDFVKILNNRWPIMEIQLIDTKVQGDGASDEIISAIHNFNQRSEVEVLVIIRGGGSADDLLTFQHENLVRVISESRIPTLVAIGHERDVSLAELVSDMRASTPSNAAEILAPSKEEIVRMYSDKVFRQEQAINNLCQSLSKERDLYVQSFNISIELILNAKRTLINSYSLTLRMLDPENILKKGYTLVKSHQGRILTRGSEINSGDLIKIKFTDIEREARVIG